jgi:MraZ protein
MDRFFATYVMNLDAKGRISIPAPFRAVLARDGGSELYCQPSPNRAALDAGGPRLIAEIEALIERYPPYSETREEIAAALYGRSETLHIDPEGRIILTETLKAHAHIGDAAAFVGLGHKFQIWEPKRFRAHLVEATRKVRALRAKLGSRKRAGDLPGASG